MSVKVERICVVGGAGHVGLPLALLLADCGFAVDVLDVNEKVFETIRAGKMPFLEDGGEELLARVLPTGRLSLTADNAVAAAADAVVCIIGTPVDEYLAPQTTLFFNVVKDMRPYFRDGQTLILRSTVYPGLSERIQALFRKEGPDVRVVFCPERVAQGHSLRELCELPQIVGAFDEVGAATAKAVFGRLTSELIETTPLEAELAKLFCNTYRYINFAVANQFDMLCRNAGVDFARVRHAATCSYPRTAGMPKPGLAAGPCLLKDTMQLAAFTGNTFMLGHSAMLINEGQPQFLVGELKKQTDLSDKCAAVLGMTFKADCDDVRDSLCFKLRKLLQLEAREVIAHDPYLSGPGFYPLEEVLRRADVLVVGVPHKPYRGLKVPPGKIVLDVWNCLKTSNDDEKKLRATR